MIEGTVGEGSEFAVGFRTVSQQIHDRTLHGIGYWEESTPTSDPGEPTFVAIGARVGRSGQVFEANGRADLVVKLFTWAAGLPEEVVRDFTQDVIRVADLHHPNVAQVFDAGVLGDGTPFVVMERLAGMTLDEAASGRSFPIAEVLPIVRGIGSALSAAHATGIAHGQLRADNIFVADLRTYGPCPKLLDFGVARLAARGGKALEPRAAERGDQLALATLAWRLLGPMSAPAIERVLARAMSPDPSQRFGSVRQLIEALEEASVNAGARGLAVKAEAARTLVRAAPPVSPRRLAVAVVAPPTGLAAAARPLTVAPPPQLESSPASLTQQFFAEGEQLDVEHAARNTSDAGTVAQEDAVEEESQLETMAASRVPRSRAQMTAAALLALGSVAMVGWTVVSLASKPDAGQDTADTSSAAAVVRPVAVSPAKAPRPAAPTNRRPETTTIQSRRSLAVQPPPFAGATRPSVTASEVPAPPRLADSPIPNPAPPGDSSGAATDAEPLGAASAQGEPLPSEAPIARTDEETDLAEHNGDEPAPSEPARPAAP